MLRVVKGVSKNRNISKLGVVIRKVRTYVTEPYDMTKLHEASK